MCGRSTSTTPRDRLGKLFEALVTDRERDESYSVSPQSDVYVVLDDGEARKVDVLRSGFVRGWAKDIKSGNRMINARAESVTPSNAYKGAFKRLVAHPVSTAVNSTRNDGPELIVEATADDLVQ